MRKYIMFILVFMVAATSIVYAETPPPVPTGVNVDGVPTATTVSIYWTAVDDAASYNVYVDGDQVNSELITDANYTVTGLTPDTIYEITVSAVGLNDLESAQSEPPLMIITDSTDYEPGLLFGQPFNITNSSVGSLPSNPTITSTTSEITDGDNATYNIVSHGLSAWYEFDGAANINRIYYSGDPNVSGTQLIGYIYDVNGNQLNASNRFDGINTLDVDYKNVKRIAFGTSGLASRRVYTFEVYGEHISDPDTTPPAVPSGLTGVPGSTEVELSWTANTEDDLAGYNVYMDGDQVNAELITDASYTVTGLTPETEYSFAVSAVDTSNNESERSAAISITTLYEPDTTPPAVPSGLTGVPGSTEVELSWTANTEDDLAGYNVYMDGDQVNTELITDASYTVTGLTPETEYSFTVSAVDTSDNESDQSAAISITTLDTPPPPPAAPGDVTTTPGPGRVTISWDPVDGAIGYNVYVDGVQANTDLITGTSYTITGLDPDTEYNFTVTAVGAGGESGTSDPAPSVPDQDNSLDLSGITPIATIGAVIGTAISWITNVIPGWVLLGLGIIFAVVLVRFLFWIVQKIKAETKFKQGKALSTKEYDRLSKEDKDRYTLRALERQDKNLRGANYDKITSDLRTKVDRHDRDRVSRMSTKDFDDKHGRAARQGMYDYLTAKGRIKERDDWVRNTGGWGIRQREGRAGRAGRPGRDSSR